VVHAHAGILIAELPVVAPRRALPSARVAAARPAGALRHAHALEPFGRVALDALAAARAVASHHARADARARLVEARAGVEAEEAELVGDLVAAHHDADRDGRLHLAGEERHDVEVEHVARHADRGAV